ncbi:uncharacterized protein [Clytia hemisphaerica]|uniref:uncharacterized protein n=1 Tax=Clytia hemisphaerica TaxID=252671 RepID=UPI0034D69691
MEEEDFLIDLDTALSVAHFQNSSRTTAGRTFSCAVDCFLEICYRLLLPEIKDKMLFEESSEFFTLLQISGSMEIPFENNNNIKSNAFRLLDEIREPLWSRIIGNCDTFKKRDCNAEFQEIFGSDIFKKLSEGERHIFEASFVVQGICNTCGSEKERRETGTTAIQENYLKDEKTHNIIPKNEPKKEYPNRKRNIINYEGLCSKSNKKIKLDNLFQSIDKKVKNLKRKANYEPAKRKAYYEPEKRKSYYDPEMQKSYYDSEKRKASYDPEKRKAFYDSEKEKAYYDPEKQKASYDPEKRKASYDPEKQKASYDPEKQKASYNPDKRKADYEKEKKKPIYNSQKRKEKYDPKQRRERYNSLKQNKNSKTQQKETELNGNIKDFQKSMKFSITQCQTCFESWPIKITSKVNSVNDFICTRCKRDKGTPKKFSADNNMKPSPVPEALKGLTQVEEMLIARAFPVMQVYTRPRGGQRAYKGHVLNLPHNVQKIADVLPREPSDIPVMIFKINGKNNTSKELVVRREKILQALLWLTGKNEQGEPNNFLYSEINIDMERLQKLPENGFIDLPDLHIMNEKNDIESGEENESDNENEDVSENEELPDLGPVNDDNNERVFDENTEMKSFLPSKLNKAKEADLTKSEILNTKTEVDIGSTPLSEFNTPYLASLAFPTLFPDTKGDPTNPAIIREIAKSETESFAEKLKHLIKFAEIDDKGKWFYRFASHPRFSFWGFNMLYRKRLISQGNFFIKQNPGEANLSIEDLQDLVRDNDHYVVMKKLQRYSKNVTGTNAYWCDVKEKLKATITQMGTPTIFWTLSMADFHWPDIHDLFSSNDESEYADFRQNIVDNPHIVDWLFTERVKSFVKHWLYESLNAEWHWYRFEFAVMRGSIHCHGLAKLKDDPGICELTEKALQGFLAQQTLSNQTEIDLENNTLLNLAVIEGNNAERQICDYVDSLMTAMNPIEGPVDEWEKPNVHPCKKRLEDIPEEDLEQDYIDLANSVQRHTKCSSAYCLRTKNDKQECRFKFPFECCEKTHLTFEKVKLKGCGEKYVPNIVLKRNDPRMNRHQQLQLQSWRANCDIQIILDHNACLNYIAKYASKAEKISDVAKEAFTSVIGNLSGKETSGNIFRKLIIKSVGERDFSAQEVMHQIMSLKLHCSSFDVVSCSLEGSRQMKIDNDGVETKTSFLDDYASRYVYEDNEIRQNLTISAKDKKIQKRKKAVVVRTFPNYSPNPKSDSYPLFCKFQLIKYKPWKDSVDSLWEGLQATNETYCQKWKEFINSSLGREFVPNWKRHYINANNFEYQVEDEENEEEESENIFLREDWMDIADLNSMPNNVSTENQQYWTDSYDSYTQDQINAMPFWIEEKKKTFENDNPTDYSQYQVENLNAEQLQAYNICLLTSYFGIAAFNINGRTLHSTLKLPIRSKLKHELKGKSLDNLQTGLKDIEYIIIDEFSVVGQRLLGWIDSRCRQATGKLETLFGGMSIILVGDVAQLPPVMDDVLYHSFPKNEIAVAGYLAYCCFRTVVKLKANMRSAGEDESQKKFRKALKNLRNGKSTMEDWNFFLTRQPEKNHVDYNKCIRLSFANEVVREHNGKMLDSLQSPIAVIKAKNTPPSASKSSSEEFGLANEVFLAKGAKVMLTRNLWSDVGLCNGSLGIVKDIIFQRNHLPPALPIAVIVKFDRYTGPSFFDDEDNCVPIVPIIETSSEDNVQKERMQIPLKLAWSITIHKSQGLTLDKVVVDLGKKESMDGLTYVALSRVKKLRDMVIESFPFERINKLSEGKRFKFRVREESRLEELAARNKP